MRPGDAGRRHGQPALELADPVHARRRSAPVPAISTRYRLGADLRHVQGVGLALVAELDLAADAWLARGRPPRADRRNDVPLQCLLRLVHIDADVQQRGVGVLRRPSAIVGADPVQPTGVRCRRRCTSGRSSSSSRNDLVVVPPLTTTVVPRSAHPQPGHRLGPVPTPGDDLGDHRVVVRRDLVTGRDAGVHPDAGPGRQGQQLDLARRRRETVVGVLGVEPGLDRVPVVRRRRRPPAGARRRPGSAASPGPARWMASVIGCSTCSRVFTSRKANIFSSRLVEELHRARAAVSGLLHQRDRTPRAARRPAPR